VWVSYAVAGMVNSKKPALNKGMNRKVALKKPPKAEKSGLLNGNFRGPVRKSGDGSCAVK